MNVTLLTVESRNLKTPILSFATVPGIPKSVYSQPLNPSSLLWPLVRPHPPITWTAPPASSLRWKLNIPPSLFEILLDTSQMAPPLDACLCRLGKGASFSRHLTAICWEMVVMNIQISADWVVMAPPTVVHAVSWIQTSKGPHMFQASDPLTSYPPRILSCLRLQMHNG